ncbi:MAG: glycoside hydrolase family 88 protein [Candidatus Cryptobacteroides sp.]
MIRFSKYILISFLAPIIASCAGNNIDSLIDKDLKRAGEQLSLMSERFDTAAITPRSWDNGVYKLLPKDWTCGFFPGVYWLYYQLTGDKAMEKEALKFTARLSDIPAIKTTHDLGFMVFCSYGKQYEVEKDSVSAAAIVEASNSLISRFDPSIGLIRSWNFGKWNYPVIIDNMMNLEMLFWASEYTGNPQYRDIAIKHADKTMENHFREDNSSYHVVSYNNDGTVESKGTHQGYSDSSSWSRGQAWALYGYTLCYRFTKDNRYLEQSENIATLIIDNKTTPKDHIPYWDYDAPNIPDEPRDASAAAVTASALLELQLYVDKNLAKIYKDYAASIIRSLSSPEYLADKGDNGFFILKHNTGAASLGSEIDVPLVYADYYFLEALKRYRELN